MELIELTYDETRTQYFVAMLKHKETELATWERIKESIPHSMRDSHTMSKIEEKCSELGWEISFIRDALNALVPEKEINNELNFRR